MTCPVDTDSVTVSMTLDSLYQYCIVIYRDITVQCTVSMRFSPFRYPAGFWYYSFTVLCYHKVNLGSGYIHGKSVKSVFSVLCWCMVDHMSGTDPSGVGGHARCMVVGACGGATARARGGSPSDCIFPQVNSCISKYQRVQRSTCIESLITKRLPATVHRVPVRYRG